MVYDSSYKIELDCEIICKAFVKYLITHACLKREHTQKYKCVRARVSVSWSVKEEQGKAKGIEVCVLLAVDDLCLFQSENVLVLFLFPKQQ